MSPDLALRARASTDTVVQLTDAVAVVGAAPDEVRGDPVALAEHLYGHWYARPPQQLEPPADAPRHLVEMFRAVHAGADAWEDGWTVDRVGPRGQIVARRGAAVRLLERGDYAASDRAGLLPVAGDAVWVTGRRDLVDPDDGWWRTGGAAWSWSAPPESGLVRLYFDLTVEELPAFVWAATSLLADEPEPWLLKCAADARVHVRADATVVYLTPTAAGRHGRPLAALGRKGGLLDGAISSGGDAAVCPSVDHPFLDPGTGVAGRILEPGVGAATRILDPGVGAAGRIAAPPLTLAVAPGVSAAVDPGGSESFGSHRCRLIAESLAGQPPTLDLVLAHLDRAGIDPARPWAHRHDPELPWER